MWRLSELVENELVSAEIAQFELRLSELKSAVLLMQASLVAKDDVASAALYEGANPMTLLADNAAHYLGEMPLSEAENQAGKWVYDPHEKVIAYLPKSFSSSRYQAAEYALKVTDSQPDWLRFKVVALLSKESNNTSHKRGSTLLKRLVHTRQSRLSLEYVEK